METAILTLLAVGANLSGMGVLFGWQPMPDGNDKIEYTVQIEPELAATLREGQSIPITSDIPDDIGPIGRIRIVVGRDDLPRQNLATRLKPWPAEQTTAKKSREGLVETQFTQPNTGSGRYGNTANNNTIMPPGGNTQTAANPFAKTLQQGKQDAQNFANGVKNQILPPSSDQLFGSGNGASSGLQNAINNTKNQVSQGFQRGVEQVADRTGQQVRQAVNDLGQSANNAIDNFGKSITGQQSLPNNRNNSISPPSSNFAGQTSNTGPQLSQPPQPPRQRPRTPQTQQTAPPNFASSSTLGTNPTSQPGDFNAPWPDTGSNQASTTNVALPPANDYRNQQAPAYRQPTQPSQRDAFDLANRNNNSAPTNFNQPGQTGFNTVNNPNNNALAGPDLNAPARQQPAGNLDPTVQQRTGPAITSDMLPNGNNMQTVGTNQNFQQRQVAKQTLGTDPTALGWENGGQAQGNAPQGSGQNFLPIALMCVVLSGSVFGNFYLFWSYFDLRGKYQGLVHGAPLRRERYSD